MGRCRSFAVFFFLLAVAQTLCAHEVRPGYLELRQTDANTYAVLWKVPAVGDMRLSIHPRFPENCKTAGRNHQVPRIRFLCRALAHCVPGRIERPNNRNRWTRCNHDRRFGTHRANGWFDPGRASDAVEAENWSSKHLPASCAQRGQLARD